jgi:hypothetical protein
MGEFLCPDGRQLSAQGETQKLKIGGEKIIRNDNESREQKQARQKQGR